jgi:hypothetical protein
MTKYIVNTLCILNQENPTPSKCMDIAINIIPVKKNKKFENFVLGIDNYQQCCEGFGAECTLGEWFEEEKFVESIEFDIDRDDSFTVKINIKDESPIYASVYNIHNGYYAHAIYYTDSSLKIDCFEKDYL